MIIDSTNKELTENLTNRDIKFLILSFVAITTATVTGLYIYYDYIKKTNHSKNQSLYNTQSVEHNTMVTKPTLKLEILTCEYYDSKWNLVISHTFYGNTEKEIEGLIKAHRQTDSFFDASFSGEFRWKGEMIKLKNSIKNIECYECSKRHWSYDN